jgi:uncharacterized membrane protein
MILDVLSIVSIGLLVGTEFAVSAFINPILAKLEPSAEAHATSLFARKLGRVMPFWYVLDFVLLIVEGVIHRHDSGMGWLTAAPILWAVVIVFTMLVLVPINNRIAATDPKSFSDRLKQEHTKWDMLHRWRVLALSAALVSLLIGIQA